VSKKVVNVRKADQARVGRAPSPVAFDSELPGVTMLQEMLGVGFQRQSDRVSTRLKP
jgi:hypothetical protein